MGQGVEVGGGVASPEQTHIVGQLGGQKPTDLNAGTEVSSRLSVLPPLAWHTPLRPA